MTTGDATNYLSVAKGIGRNGWQNGKLYKLAAIHHWKMETTQSDPEEVEWQRVKTAILRIDHTTREINQKLSHLIEVDRLDRDMPTRQNDDD